MRATEQQRQRVKLQAIEMDRARMMKLTSHEIAKDLKLMAEKGVSHTDSYKRARSIHGELVQQERDKAIAAGPAARYGKVNDGVAGATRPDGAKPD